MTDSRDQTREDLPMTANTKVEWVSDGKLEHLHGVPWYQAATPRKLHRCKPQTRGIITGSLIERCACGAISRDGHPWMERNTA